MDNKTTTSEKLMLNIGCGQDYLEGWVNIDDNLDNNIKKLDLISELMAPLNFKQKSVDIIYDKSFFEKFHLNQSQLIKLLINYRIILKDDGLLRVVIPSAKFKTKTEFLLKSLGFKNIEILELCDATKENKPPQEKIPCYVLVFFDDEVAKKSLDFLTKYSDRLDIRVIENYSENTETKFKPYITDLLEKRKISKYYLFDENIGFNAIEKVVEAESEYLQKHEYFMITDGDLTSNDNNWIDEQIDILKKNPEVIISGVKLDMSNLPSLDKYPDADRWVPPARQLEGKNYLDGQTGWVLTLLKTDYFFLIKRLMKRDQQQLSDGRIFRYTSYIDKKWVRTKETQAYHLTWDTYSQLDHPYTIWKTAQTYDSVWSHKKYCKYTLIEKT